MEAKYGDAWSWNGTARALQFKRALAPISQPGAAPFNASAVAAVSRFNEFQTDPFSEQGCAKGWHSGAQAIASRYDLTSPGADCDGSLAQYPFGAIDSKVVSALSAVSPDGSTIAFAAQSGPTTYSQPPFDFRQWPENELPRRGMPLLWDFPWVQFALPGAPTGRQQ